MSSNNFSAKIDTFIATFRYSDTDRLFIHVHIAEGDNYEFGKILLSVDRNFTLERRKLGISMPSKPPYSTKLPEKALRTGRIRKALTSAN